MTYTAVEKKAFLVLARIGGAARAKALTKARRSEIARLAARARWGKKKPTKAA